LHILVTEKSYWNIFRELIKLSWFLKIQNLNFCKCYDWEIVVIYYAVHSSNYMKNIWAKCRAITIKQMVYIVTTVFWRFKSQSGKIYETFTEKTCLEKCHSYFCFWRTYF
jgi:hypothetical protein